MAAPTQHNPSGEEVHQNPRHQPPGGQSMAPATPYTVRLPIFEGPLDLLLHLIERNQLEITAISIVAVTDQFIAYLRTWDEPPMPRLAEFITMAARLLLIKSRSLLPRQQRQQDDEESDPLDDAEELRRHLLEYKLARELAAALRARQLAGLQSFARPGRLVDPEAMLVWTPPRLVGLDARALSAVFRRVLAEKRLAEPEPLPLPRVTVAEKIAEVEALLAQAGRALLEDILRACKSRLEIVVTFLAVLELWHQGRVIVRQEGLFGPIEVLPGPGRNTQTAVTEVMEIVEEQVTADGDGETRRGARRRHAFPLSAAATQAAEDTEGTELSRDRGLGGRAGLSNEFDE